MNPLFRIDFSISDSLKIVRKSVLIYETIIPFIFKPINIIYIYFNPGIGKSDKDGSCYEMVDEKVFMEKMAEWHVELEDNRPEEIPPWKEQI